MIKIKNKNKKFKKLKFRVLNLFRISKFGFRILIVSLAFLPWYTQTIAQENDLFLIVSPSSPSPNQSYSVEAKSFVFDPSQAYFEWFKDGKKIDEGTGIVKKIFTGEKLGTQTTIKVSASSDGKTFSASAQITANSVDFIINPLTYTPFGYRGSALSTPGSVVEIYAVPHIFSGGRRLNTTALTYKWALDDSPVQEQSGRGKSKLAVALPKTPLGEIAVTIDIFSGEELVAQKRERMAMYSPQIVFYQTNSLLGKSNRAISELVAPPGTEFALAVEPFFSDFNSLLRGAISWFAGGAKIEPARADNLFTLELSSPSNEESENNILFRIEDEKNVFQNKDGRINIKIKN